MTAFAAHDNAYIQSKLDEDDVDAVRDVLLRPPEQGRLRAASLMATEAAHRDAPACLRMLMDYPMDDADGTLHRVLFISVRDRSPRCARIALECGADPDANGGVALRIAAEEGTLDEARALLDAGANPDPMEGDALRRAILGRHHHVAQLLLERGADASAMNGVALVLAAERSDPDSVRLLLDHGVDACSQNGGALFKAACRRNRKHADPIIRDLLDHGASTVVDTVAQRLLTKGHQEHNERLQRIYRHWLSEHLTSATDQIVMRANDISLDATPASTDVEPTAEPSDALSLGL